MIRVIQPDRGQGFVVSCINDQQTLYKVDFPSGYGSVGLSFVNGPRDHTTPPGHTDSSLIIILIDRQRNMGAHIRNSPQRDAALQHLRAAQVYVEEAEALEEQAEKAALHAASHPEAGTV